jgi:hypothetical protein
MEIVGAIDKLDVADGALTVVALPSVAASAFGGHVRDAHHLPDIHDHFGIANQEHEHRWVAIDRLLRQTAIDARALDHRHQLAARLGGQRIQGERTDRFLAGLCRGVGFVAPGGECGRSRAAGCERCGAG